MSNFATHIKKYEMFKKDAENRTVSHPSRIEAYFAASFQLIEACLARHILHINKHQLVRPFLEREQHIFGKSTDRVWRAFQTIENQIRPGQEYGGKINGMELKRAKERFEEIKAICTGVLSNDSKGF